MKNGNRANMTRCKLCKFKKESYTFPKCKTCSRNCLAPFIKINATLTDNHTDQEGWNKEAYGH